MELPLRFLFCQYGNTIQTPSFLNQFDAPLPTLSIKVLPVFQRRGTKDDYGTNSGLWLLSMTLCSIITLDLNMCRKRKEFAAWEIAIVDDLAADVHC